MAQTTPSDTSGMPSGIPYIISNEAAERFSFYGMKAALAIFLADYLGVIGGSNMSEAQATVYVSLFVSAVYITPFLGAVIADAFWGKYRTIITLSIVYCLGHLSLAAMGVGGLVQVWLILGLGMIAIGAGGIKPCVSAHVGDQFGKNNQHLLPKIFNIFYLSINVGAVISNLAIPWILKWHGPHWAFGIPGVLMALATVAFWKGRDTFAHVPAERSTFFRETFSRQGLAIMAKLIPLYLFVAVFWCLFDQTATTLVFQATRMDLTFLGVTFLPSQIQAFNPFLIVVLIPLFTYVIYPLVGKVITLTPLRKVGAGLFLMVLFSGIIVYAQEAIDRGDTPSIGWQLLAYIVLTTAEVMISIVCLEFSYTQAPKSMKSLIMALFLLAVTAGNLLTAGVSHFIQIPSSPLTDPPAAHVTTAEALVNTAATTGDLPAQLDRDDLTYTRLDAKSARISSPGPDGVFRTQDDLNTSISLVPTKTVDQGTWLARHSSAGAADTPTEKALVEITHATGGGVTLEGAAYFWLFAKIMLLTFILFIPYSLLYKPTKNIA